MCYFYCIASFYLCLLNPEAGESLEGTTKRKEFSFQENAYIIDMFFYYLFAYFYCITYVTIYQHFENTH